MNHRHYQNIVVICLILLIILILLWELKIAPLRDGGSWLAVKSLPLCLPLSGCLKGRIRTFQYLSLFIPFYMAEAIMRLSDKNVYSKYCASGELILSIMIFIACLLFVRFKRLS